MQNATLTLDDAQFQELHIILGERILALQERIKHPNPRIVEIAQRQLDRVRPLYSMVEGKVHENLGI